MNSRGTRRFWTHYRRLPFDVRQLARKAYQLFRTNPHHPSLHFKRIQGQEPVYSIRISLGFRAIGLVEGDEVLWIWIGSHAEYDELLKRKSRPGQ